MTTAFHDHVYLKYQVYNSLFLTLPFGDILQTGTLLPLLEMRCARDLEAGKNPRQIIEEFLSEHAGTEKADTHFDVLFAFIKYVERQVVLFDAIEDAAFQHVHTVDGPGTLPDLFTRTRLRSKQPEFRNKIQEFSLRVVLTAHPTQFYPGRVLSIISDLDQAIRSNDITGINEILLQLGKTPMVQKERPTPLTEAVRLVWYLKNVFYHAISSMMQELQEGLGVAISELPMERLVRIGFWPGGDRDGNPFVDVETTRNVARVLRQTALECYLEDLGRLKRKFTFKAVYEQTVAASDRVRASIAREPNGYASSEELLEDLGAIRSELEHQSLHEFMPYLDMLIARVRIFGFHLATIDIRQDSSVIDALIEKLVLIHGWSAGEEWSEMSEEHKLALLAAQDADLAQTELADAVQMDVLQSISVMSEIVTQNGQRGCHRYIISNSQSRLHVMQVFHLMRWRLGEVPFDIAPLFETIDDLASAASIMAGLYQDTTYAAHLAQRGSVQHIMLGFSDGTKDGGYMRANWSIFQAKEEMTRVSREHGIQVVFFDGRGGPPARGGGNSNRFYASLGSNIADSEVQLTVQGQTISSNFGTETSARYNLEQVFSAGLENSLFKGDIREVDDEARKVISEIAAISFEAYKAFKEDEAFLTYLEQLGTLPYYAMTNIGSRPVKRSGSDKLTLKSLRAIPFVGSWNQMKQNVPGFYGLGTALQKFKKKGELDKIKALYQDTLFFRTLIDNSMMSLSKSYFPLTQYLKDHKQFGRIWKNIHDEYLLTKSLLLEVSGQNELLEHSPNGRDSIKLRERLVLPVLVIQQYALQMSRELEEEGRQAEADIYHTMVMRTMFAIINAGRNSA